MRAINSNIILSVLLNLFSTLVAHICNMYLWLMSSKYHENVTYVGPTMYDLKM